MEEQKFNTKDTVPQISNSGQHLQLDKRNIQLDRLVKLFSFHKGPRAKAFLMILFVVIIAAIGSYFIYTSFAQDEEIASVQVNQLKTTSEKLKNDIRAYKSKMPDSLKPSLADIKKIAQERKALMLNTVTSDPVSFLSNVISNEDLANLPEEAKTDIEKMTTIHGIYTYKQVNASNRLKPKVDHSVKTKDKAYNLYFSGGDLFINPNSSTDFYGYAIDNTLVVNSIPEIGYKPNMIITSSQIPSVHMAGLATQAVTGSITTTIDGSGTIIPGVPGYVWRDGCGPTTMGMIIGYYDGNGYDNLVEGSATTATNAVNQMIASHSVAGEARHYEDYSLPKETTATAILSDKSELPTGDEHAADSIADFMKASWSNLGLAYGWSYTHYSQSAFNDYIKSKYPASNPWSTVFYGSSLTWELYKAEIDAKRPVHLMIDVNGSGDINHSVVGVGYRESNGYPEYAMWTTWSDSAIAWSKFQPLGTSVYNGVGGAYFFNPTGSLMPTINTFTATPTSISSGQYADLSWNVTNASSSVVTITKGSELIGTFANEGIFRAYPSSSSVYTLTTSNIYGTATKYVSVEVKPTPTVTPTPAPIDNTPPVVTITGITNGAFYTTGKLNIIGNAYDESGISKIQIYVSNKLVATCSNVTSCSYQLNIKKLAKGTHVINVNAYDKTNALNMGTSTLSIIRK